MAKLYFRYGVMGSSKSANALMVRYNYEERGQSALMVKPALDAVKAHQCIIVDEAQFLTHAQVDYLTEIVDDMNVPVICYGLRADFSGRLFPGSEALLACADIIEEVKTICWCGKKAICNARFDKNGVVLKEGEQVVLGANDCYIGLCRRHWKAGNLGPDWSENHDL